jgi:uncharacterized coiled-coil protein SlyX
MPASTPSELSMEDKINHIFLTVNKIDSTLAEQQLRVSKLESTVDTLSKELLSLKTLVNNREQELRSNVIRLIGYPITEEEKAATDSRFLAKKVFTKIVCPILNAAKLKGHLAEKVPTLENAIIDCYRMGPASANIGSSPPIIIKLTSPSYRIAIMRAKKDSTPAPTDADRAMGARRYLISEDLTPPTFKMLKELQSSEEVAKAWTINGRIHLLPRGSSNIYRVPSVFEDAKSIINSALNK